MPPKRKHSEPRPAELSDEEESDTQRTTTVITPVLRFTQRVNRHGHHTLSVNTKHVQFEVEQQENCMPLVDFPTSYPNISDDSMTLPNLSSTMDDAFAELAAIDPAYFDALSDDLISVGPRKKRPSDYPLKEWIKDSDVFLEEDIRWEGRGEYMMENCCQCLSSETLYRCQDCEGGELICRTCIVDYHCANPLHRIQEWTGSFFKPTTLKKLGLRIQLGHRLRERCHVPQTAWNNDFVVLDTTGIHEVRLDFCNCESAQDHFIQLLRFRWFPASVKSPKTAVTFRLLKHFQILSFKSKVSAFEFYTALARETENTGISPLKDRYRPFMRVIRQFRYIKMLKRAARGHDPGGIAATRPGECGVLCPACPQPGKNLPVGWQNAPPELRFLYCLFLAIDANFRLKRKAVSSDEADPSLLDGKAYFVAEKDFKNYLKEFGDLVIQEAIHVRITMRLMLSGRQLDLLQPVLAPLIAQDMTSSDRLQLEIYRRVNGIYVNMDYLFFSSLKHSDVMEIVVSYDIACQWSKNLWNRMSSYPHWMHVDHDGGKQFHFLIPKFHLPAHVMACQTIFSFNYNRNVGRTDGEAPERGWSHINPIATSTREMGPGSRRDTLDDHFGAWNWKKTKLMGPTLLRKIKLAVVSMNDHVFLHNQFVIGIADDDLVQKWEKELTDWEEDHQKPNPFEASFKKVTLDSVKHQLALTEAADLASGVAYILHEDISASMMLTMGMDFEIQKRRLKLDTDVLGLHATDDQKRKIQIRATTLQRKIFSWMDVQQLYMPSARIARLEAQERSDHDTEEKVEDIELWLPSVLPKKHSCDIRLRQMEWRLRQAQANDALDELRNSLRLRSHLYIDKDRFQRGQRANTRSRSVIHRIQARVDFAAVTYQNARALLHRLSKLPGIDDVGWEPNYPILKPSDIRALSDPEDTVPMRKKSGDAASAPATIASEGHRTLSWIWRRLGERVLESEGEHLVEDLRIEFCKSKARAARWTEEVQLLIEEMRRVLDFFDSRTRDWNESAVEKRWSATRGTDGADKALIEGRIAYAKEQAAQFHAMRAYCKHIWCFVPAYIQWEDKNVIPPEVAEDDEDDDV